MTTLATLPSSATAMATLTAEHPLLAIALKDMPAVEDIERTASICTDGSQILVDPAFLAERTDEGRVYMLAFISLMQTNMCLDRRGDREHEAWGMACNMATHLTLAQIDVKGRPPEADGLFNPSLEGKTSEEIYDSIMDGRTMIMGQRVKDMINAKMKGMEPVDGPAIRMDTAEVEQGMDEAQIDAFLSKAQGGYTPDDLSEAFDIVKDADH